MIEKIYIYFFDPRKEGYTLLKTLVYSITFLISIFLIYKILKKLKIKIDNSFLIFSHFLALPFSAIRVLEDYKIISGIIFITPWIEGLYLITFLVLISTLKKFLKKKYEKPIFIFGILIFFALLFQLHIKNFLAIQIYSFIVLFTFLLVFLLKINIFNRLVIISQIYEALITTINVSIFGFFEQHILSRLILEIYPLIYLLIKLLFAILLIKTLDLSLIDSNLKNYIKTSFSVLSFSVGTRNLLQALAY
ncbi:MAG: DUF63 family protein [Nanoarchaeales archaeon]